MVSSCGLQHHKLLRFDHEVAGSPDTCGCPTFTRICHMLPASYYSELVFSSFWEDWAESHRRITPLPHLASAPVLCNQMGQLLKALFMQSRWARCPGVLLLTHTCLAPFEGGQLELLRSSASTSDMTPPSSDFLPVLAVRRAGMNRIFHKGLQAGDGSDQQGPYQGLGRATPGGRSFDTPSPT